MINKESVAGTTLSAFGAWLAWEAKNFPTLGGMSYGTGLLPTIARSSAMGTLVGANFPGGGHRHRCRNRLGTGKAGIQGPGAVLQA